MLKSVKKNYSSNEKVTRLGGSRAIIGGGDGNSRNYVARA